MNRLLRTCIPLLLIILVVTLIADAASAQNILDRARRAAERGAERAVEREAQRRADRAVTNAIECVAGDRQCADRAEAESREVTYVDANGNPVSAGATAGAAQPAAPGEGVWANYDFVPGDRVLFYEDYTNDRVGNFPQRFEFVRGNWEVVEWQGRRLLRTTGPRRAALRILLPEALPDRFTIETEAYIPHSNHRLTLLTRPPRNHLDNSVDYNYFSIGHIRSTGVDAKTEDLPTSFERDPRLRESLIPIRIQVDGSYAKVYVGENRTGNVPTAVLPRSEALYIENDLGANERFPIYIGPIRVAAGGQPMYDTLLREGRVATQGIYFDTGSAVIRPESTPTLQEITRMLQQHGDLRLRIEGHTDNTGTAATNQQLSERRAQAVREYLAQQGVVSGRLEAAGMGQTQPVADNTTPEGRQQNRRVELVRL